MYNVKREKSVSSGTLGCFFLSLLPFSITFADYFFFYIYLRLFDGINLKLGYERGESENCDDYILLELIIMNGENLN